MPEKLVEALDITTQLAMAAGLDALREAGIPLVHDLQAHDHRQRPARALDAAGAAARRDGRHFRQRLPRRRSLRRRVPALLRLPEPACEQLALLEELRQATTDEHTLHELQPARRPAARRAGRASPTSSTAASSSASCPWATASSPSTSARAAPTPRSTPPAPARRRPSPSPRTGFAPAAAGA